MSGRSRQDVRRQLFRGIGSRISSNNNANTSNSTSKQTPDVQIQQIERRQKGLGSSKYRVITPIPRSKFNAQLTPSTVSSSSSGVSHNSEVDKLIINRSEDMELLDYDYRTFSSRHPLRVSSVRAWEQAESTAGILFVKERELDASSDTGAIVKFPGMGVRETQESLKTYRTGANGYIPPPAHDLFATRPGKNASPMQGAKNAAKFQLDSLYESKPDVVGEMDIAELDEMRALNDEFEGELDDLRRSRRLQRLSTTPYTTDGNPARDRVYASAQRAELLSKLELGEEGWFAAQPQLADE